MFMRSGLVSLSMLSIVGSLFRVVSDREAPAEAVSLRFHRIRNTLLLRFH